MSRIRMQGGRVIVPPDKVVLLPEVLTSEFLDAVFSSEQESDGHVHRIHLKLPWAEKVRFEATCTEFGDDYQAKWAQAAIAWSSILNQDNQWDLGMFVWCYAEPFPTWLIQEIRLTETGIWFVQLMDNRLATLEEFSFEYGRTLQEHLQDKVTYDTSIVHDIIKTMSEELIAQKVVLSFSDGSIGATVRVGPASVPPKHWQYKTGEEFIGVDDP